MPTTARSTLWVDVNGRQRITLLRSTGSPSALAAAIAAKSNAAISRYWQGDEVAGAGAPVSAVYATCADVAELIYQDPACAEVRLSVLAPLASLFLADHETVDVAQVAAINAAALGTLITANGTAVTEYIGGMRRRR